MIEVENINALNKGTLLATCDVHIVPWKTRLHDVKIFQKGNNRWLGMPAKELVDSTGEKKYIELITFDTDVIRNRFRSQVMGAIDKFLESNPEMKPADVIKDENFMPF